MPGKYASFAELAISESAGVDYRVSAVARPASPVLIVAPHGGTIEVGTSEIAALIAADQHSFFAFEGLKPHGRNRELHITSHRFDHPECLAGRHPLNICNRAARGRGVQLEITYDLRRSPRRACLAHAARAAIAEYFEREGRE